MWNGKKVIDADAHHHERPDIWETYSEPEWRERMPKVLGVNSNQFVYAPSPDLPAHDLAPAAPEAREQYMMDKYGDAYDEWWSPQIRLRDMDKYGWDIQVILSTNANRVMEASCQNPELGLAMARA